jgi:hypothetical protein
VHKSACGTEELVEEPGGVGEVGVHG